MSEPKWINDRYKIQGRLGRGGSSTVYRAIDTKDIERPEVAVKLLGQLPDIDQETQRVLFDREVRALSTLRHPTIVRLLDHGEDTESQFLYLILEYIERAESLRDRVLKWEPDPLECIDLLIELLEAVSYAHQENIIHRDLKPENILMGSDGRPRIIDFGVSKILGTLRSGHTVGDLFTRPYASPEQVDQQLVSPASDIYSLAAVFYFMLTRNDPASSLGLSDQFKTLTEIPVGILRIAQRMAAIKPSDRYDTAHQIILDLQLAQRQLQSRNQKFYLQLSRSAIQDLYDQLPMPQEASEARKIVQGALDIETVYIAEPYNTQNGYYDLIGDSISLRCAAVGRTHFVAVSVKARMQPHTLERMCQDGFPIYAQWRVGVERELPPSDATPLNFLDEIDEFFRRKKIKQEKRERRISLIDTWRNILHLDFKLKEDTLSRLKYNSWSPTQNNSVIKVQLANEVNLDEILASDQPLEMTSTQGGLLAVGNYLRQEENFVLISKRPGINLNRISRAGEISVLKREWAAVWKRQHRALNTVVDERCKNTKLPEVLIDPKQAGRLTEEPIERYFDEKLDEPKRDAVRAALSAQDMYLIQGPPGTGKTDLICELVAQILDRKPKARILLVSQSNVAVDHVLKRLESLPPEIRRVRIGREERIGHDTEMYSVHRRLEGWTQQIHAKSQEYLGSLRVESDERKDLEYYLNFVRNEVRPKISNKPSKSQLTENEDLITDIELLRYQFSGLEIKPTDYSLNKLIEHIEAQINTQKSPLELTIEEWLKRVNKLDDFEEAYLEECSILAGTCVGIAGKRNLPERFDWVIVDEAGRATPGELLIPLVRAERIVLVGDHKQLPPVIEYELQQEATEHPDIDQIWLKKSLFEYLFEQLGSELKTVLKYQYRMHPHIAHLISNVFYREEQLETGIDAKERVHGWNRWATPVVWYSTSQLGDRFESVNEFGSKFNLCEANIIVNLLSDLDKDLYSRKERKNVAVICGYDAQKEQLKRQLDVRWKNLIIEINTVDAFQGRQQDIVFYSVVRSNSKREIGFLEDVRRLNVALSRARELLLIVGDHRMVAEAYTRDRNPFKEVIAHIMEHPLECTLMEAKDDIS